MTQTQRILRAAVAATIAAVVVGIVAPTKRLLAPACATGDVHVAVVVDAGSGGGVSAVCVPAGARDNGAIVLAARASALGRPQPRFAGSGLLCAIDGFPKTGCGVRDGGHYAYWSYFHGTAGRWSYENIGPAASRVHTDVVEGWRWQPEGAGSPNDPAPRGSATATATCVPAPPPTTVPPPPHTPTPVRAAGAPGATSGPAATQPGSTATTGVPVSAAVNPIVPGSASATTRPGRSSVLAVSSSTIVERGVASRLPQSGSGGGGAPVGLIVGAVLIAALGAGGFVAARRRSRPVS